MTDQDMNQNSPMGDMGEDTGAAPAPAAQRSMGQGQSNQMVNPRKMFVGNLSWSLTTDDLREIFGEFGTVEDATVMSDKFTGRSKGFGFVTMASEEEAQAAIAGLHQKDISGRSMVVNIAQPPRPREDRGGFGGGRGGDRRGGGGGSFGGGRGGDRRGGSGFGGGRGGDRRNDRQY